MSDQDVTGIGVLGFPKRNGEGIPEKFSEFNKLMLKHKEGITEKRGPLNWLGA